MLKIFSRREALSTFAAPLVASKISFAQTSKKRIVILMDGTSNDEVDRKINKIYKTNVASLHSPRKAAGPLIVDMASDGVAQKVIYHPGPRKLATGFDLANILKDVYESLVKEYENGDEIYLFGFSRGAYGVRALANLVSNAGIRRRNSSVRIETMLNEPSSDVHESREIACVGVWDTVSSFVLPGGTGTDSVADLISKYFLKGMGDNRLPKNVKVALHAVAVDEQRREFIPKFFTSFKGLKPEGARFVEQAWFPGVHSNVGGGYEDSGLSDLALIWMLARVQEQTSLQFDLNNVRKETESANIDGKVYREELFNLVNKIDELKHFFMPTTFRGPGRPILYKENDENNVNEVVHWSVKLKYGRPCEIDAKKNVQYEPANFNPHTPTEKIIRPSEKELALLPKKVTELLPSQ